jgi:DNA-binding MurR/RpiR family transcriptional regulator
MYRERIQESYEHLSKSQKRIADYLMTSHREAAFMTASQLAQVLKVDVATITRFAQRLNYPCYPEMLDEVQAVVRKEMSAGFRPVEGTNENGRRFIRTLTVERENLERTLTGISVEAAEQAVDVLAAARRIYVLGQHTARFMATNLVIRLDVLGMDAVALEGDAVSLALHARAMGPRDAVVGFGFSGYANDVAAVMQVARQRGAKTIGISGSAVSPVARVADVTLLCVATSSVHIPSEVAIYAVIEGIFQTLAAQKMEAFTTNMQAFDRFYREFTAHLTRPAGSAEESLMKLY